MVETTTLQAWFFSLYVSLCNAENADISGTLRFYISGVCFTFKRSIDQCQMRYLDLRDLRNLSEGKRDKEYLF